MLNSKSISLAIRNSKTLLILLFLFITVVCQAQYPKTGSWSLMNFRYKFSGKWSLFFEGQIRSLQFYNHFHYYEIKGGPVFTLSDAAQFALGLGTYQTFSPGENFNEPKVNDEFRIWPMVLISQSIGKIKIEQRYRAEFRFTNGEYRNRFRYRAALTFPLSKNNGNFTPLQFTLNNELFFSNKAPFFERNRIAGLFIYRMNKHVMIQSGYLYQFDNRINSISKQGFLQTGFFFELTKHSEISK